METSSTLLLKATTLRSNKFEIAKTSDSCVYSRFQIQVLRSETHQWGDKRILLTKLKTIFILGMSEETVLMKPSNESLHNFALLCIDMEKGKPKCHNLRHT